MKKLSYSLLISFMVLSASPAIADSYIFNPDGPTGNSVVDTSYNFGKDVTWTVLKLAFLPVELVTQIIANALI